MVQSGEVGRAKSDGLWYAYRETREQELRDRLIAHYLPFARAVAVRTFESLGRQMAYDDCLQCARVGLIEAIERFDVDRGVPFEGFAVKRIRGSILDSAPDQSERSAQHFSRVSLRAERGESLVGALPDPGSATLLEIADLVAQMGLGALLDLSGAAGSNEPENPYQAAELADLQARLRDEVEQLPTREREIIQGHYYLHHSFQAIAQRMNLSRARVSQLHSRAVGMLRERFRASSKLDDRF